MKKYIKHVLLVTIIFFLFFLVYRNQQRLELYQLTKKSLYTYFDDNQITTDFIQKGIDDGLLEIFQKDTFYIKKIPIYKNEFLNIFPINQDDEFSTIQHEFYYLYQFFTEPMKIVEYPDYCYKLPWFIIYFLINEGWFSPDCGGVSTLGSRYLKEKVPHILDADRLFISSNHHVISTCKFLSNDEEYLLAIDFQNGFYGPIDLITRQPIKKNKLFELVKNNQFDSLDLYFLPEYEIKKKKNLVTQKFALNIFPDDEDIFYKASVFNKFFAFRLTYPPNYYVWFRKNKINRHDLMKEICRELVDNMNVKNTSVTN